MEKKRKENSIRTGDYIEQNGRVETMETQSQTKQKKNDLMETAIFLVKHFFASLY